MSIKHTKTIMLIPLIFITIALYGCNNDNNSDSNLDINKSEEANYNILNEKQGEIDQRLETGEISKQEAEQLSQEAENNFKKTINPSAPNKMPDWVINLGIPEPIGLGFNQYDSYQTSINNPNQEIDSIILVYSGDPETVSEQATQMATAANIPEYDDPDILYYGVSGKKYSNISKLDKDFFIEITDNNEGLLTISVKNVEHLKNLEKQESVQ